MMKRILTITLTVAACLVLTTSCSKDLFDKKAYDEYVSYQFMIDNVDTNHDWCLTKTGTTVFTVPESANYYGIQVLTDNPYTVATAEIATEGACSGGKVKLTYTVPLTHQTLYAVVVNSNGGALGVVPFNYGTPALDVNADNLQRNGIYHEPTYQTFTYLYETTFPLPDDFDYNDLVLRVTKSYTADSHQVDLTVTVVAAGTLLPYAAAIQLAGVRYDDITSVEIVEGERLDKDYPFPRTFIESDRTLVRGRSGEAVISLFENVHWVLNRKFDDLGNILALKYNTSPVDVDKLSGTVPAVSATYRITCKDTETAHSITFDRIDPFVVNQAKMEKSMSLGIWEVHTYACKFNGVLRDVFKDRSAYDNHISWALAIPKPDFRYPLEGIALCTYNNETGETFGPYAGYASWMQNHNAYHNWFQTETVPDLLY